MVKKGKIAHYREKLDRSLASPDLKDEKKIENLVKDHILRSTESTRKDLGSSDNVIAKRTAEVSNFLGMLRSASENHDGSPHATHQPSWKLKQDTEEFRVMYREGPVGSPFHSLLAEGYVDAPVDVCLCVSWESELYPKWFPETFIPTFKIVVAKRLQKVRIGEEISLVRVKLSWPLSSREVILHYFEFEYLQDGLVIVIMNSISDVDEIQMETHGFTKKGIPEADNTVRMDLVGGFALQKVTENRSYFRTIASMDIKLDFVPPSLINFISRQLIGSGFRLYQKIVGSVSKGDESFAKALSDPLYSRIREALFSNGESQEHKTTDDEDQKLVVQDASRNSDATVLPNNHVNKSLHELELSSNEIEEINENKHDNILGDMFKVEDQNVYSVQYRPTTEIEEEEENKGENAVQNEEVDKFKDNKEDVDPVDQLDLESHHKKVPLSPQVEHALATLDKMITVVREGRLKAVDPAQSLPDETKCSGVEKHVNWADKSGSTEELVKATPSAPANDISIGGLRSTDSDGRLQEANHDQKSPVRNPPSPNWSKITPSASNSPVSVSPKTRKVNGFHENNVNVSKKSGQQRKWRLCCLHLISEKFVS